jgi:UDP-glucose 4-epimerase
MKVIIFGGAGFVGLNLISALNSITSDYLVIDNFTHTDSRNFIAEINKSNVIEMDLNNTSELRRILKEYKADCIIHLAANSDIRPDSRSSINRDFRDTLGTTISFIEAVKNIACQKVIFASSSAIYGNQGNSVDHNSHEALSLSPISDYGKAKLACEYALQFAFHNKQLQNLTIIRFPNVVGKFATHGILYDFMIKYKYKKEPLEVLGDGTQSKPYINVRDLVDCIINIIEQPSTGKIDFINLGPSENTTVKEIAEVFVELLEWNTTIKYGTSKEGWLGDVPTYSFKSGLLSGKLQNSNEAIKEAILDLKVDERFTRD